MRKPFLPVTASAEEQGSALLAAMLILMLVVALASAQIADTLVEVRTSSNERYYRIAHMSALSTLGFALNVIRKTARENPSWNWNSYLAGPDGIMAPCSLVGEARYNPISVSAAIQCRFGELCNNCWDDGVLQDLIAGRVLIGPLGLSLRKANDGSARPFLPPNPGSCSPWSDAHLSPAIAHVWLKISDNNELDNNPAVDTDSVVILRILAAAKNLPFDGPSLTGKQRNSVARLEAWLRRNADGSLTVLSVRQVTS